MVRAEPGLSPGPSRRSFSVGVAGDRDAAIDAAAALANPLTSHRVSLTFARAIEDLPPTEAALAHQRQAQRHDVVGAAALVVALAGGGQHARLGLRQPSRRIGLIERQDL